jgi:hypothetical protein
MPDKPMPAAQSNQGPALLLAIALAAAAYLSFSAAIFNDGDTSWHLAAGQLILANFSVPETDPFSFTFSGRPWTAHEWLSEALMAGALKVGGWSGLALLVGLAVAALILIVGSEAARRLAPRRMLGVLVALFVIIAPAILARPHVLAWPILAGWTLILIRARDADRAPHFAWALLMLLWANLHGSFAMGLLLIGVFGLEALIESEDRRRVLIGWGVFGAASLTASLLTPHGAHGLLFPLAVSAMKTLPLIAEWRPTSFAEDKAFLAIVAAVAMVLILRRPKISLVRLALLAGLFYLALTHARHQPILAIIGTLVLLKPLGEASAEPARASRRLLLACLIGLAIVSGARLAVPIERQDAATYPITAILRLPPELRASPVLNSYSFGGPLILHRVRPYIDGRADLYGDAFLRGHQTIVDGDMAAFDRAINKWGIRWTILSPGEGLVPLLDRKSGWRRLYADRWAVVHVGPPQANPTAR